MVFLRILFGILDLYIFFVRMIDINYKKKILISYKIVFV